MDKSAIEKGSFFEKYVMQKLEEDGYVILENNYVYQKYEIDIIAKKKATVVFVEVKARRQGQNYAPEDAITIKKMRNIYYAARNYKNKLINMKIEVSQIRFRFDAATVLFDEKLNVTSYKYMPDYFKSDEI